MMLAVMVLAPVALGLLALWLERSRLRGSTYHRAEGLARARARLGELIRGS